jgi:hypothetical protein
MKKKMETIAVLRCLGATAGQIFGAYLLQAVASAWPARCWARSWRSGCSGSCRG